MGQFTVICWEAADDELLRLWLEFPAMRSRITDAAREIDKLLADRPENVGELVHEGLYALEVDPCACSSQLKATIESCGYGRYE